MEAAVKVAVVTGANKGIGFAIARGLCKKFLGHVYLTARDESRGKDAVKELEKENLHSHFHQLDIEDVASVERLKKFLAEKYGGLDVLVNNAGIAFPLDSTEPDSKKASLSMKCNFWGTLDVCNNLFPLLRSHARVVHLSSVYGINALNKCSVELRDQMRACSSVDEVERYMNKYVHNVKQRNLKEQGWPKMSFYAISKLGLALVAPIQQQKFDSDTTRKDIIMNACCPGYVATDMTRHRDVKGAKTIDQGADTPLYLALLPENDVTSPRGSFVIDRVIYKV